MSFSSSRRTDYNNKESYIYREVGSERFIAIRTINEIEDIIDTSEAYMTDPTVIFNSDNTKVLFYYNTKDPNEIEEMETLFKRTVKKGSTITLSDAFYLDESSGDDTKYDISGTYKFESYDSNTKTVVAVPISINSQSTTYLTYHSKYWLGSLLWTTADAINTRTTSYEIVNFIGSSHDHSFTSVFGEILPNDRIEIKDVGNYTVESFIVDTDEEWERIKVKEEIPEVDLLGTQTFIRILRSDKNQPNQPRSIESDTTSDDDDMELGACCNYWRKNRDGTVTYYRCTNNTRRTCNKGWGSFNARTRCRLMDTPCPETSSYGGCCVPVLPEGYDCVQMKSESQCTNYGGTWLGEGSTCLASEGENSCNNGNGIGDEDQPFRSTSRTTSTPRPDTRGRGQRQESTSTTTSNANKDSATARWYESGKKILNVMVTRSGGQNKFIINGKFSLELVAGDTYRVNQTDVSNGIKGFTNSHHKFGFSTSPDGTSIDPLYDTGKVGERGSYFYITIPSVGKIYSFCHHHRNMGSEIKVIASSRRRSSGTTQISRPEAYPDMRYHDHSDHTTRTARRSGGRVVGRRTTTPSAPTRTPSPPMSGYSSY